MDSQLLATYHDEDPTDSLDFDVDIGMDNYHESETQVYYNDREEPDGQSLAVKENLKISITNDGDVDPSVAFVKIENDSNNGDENDAISTEATKIQLNVDDLLSLRERSRVYENKGDKFETGVDVCTVEAKAKRLERAKRFGLDNNEVDEKKKNVKALYESLGLTEGQTEVNGHEIRHDVIMLHGVNDLSTQDIFSYFKVYPPRNIEWIDDTCCNVVFPDVNTVHRVLVNMSESIRRSKASGRSEVKSRLNTKKGQKSKELDDDYIDLMDTSTLEVTSEPGQGDREGTKVHMDTYLDPSTDDEDSESGVVLDEKEIPEGEWRLAKSHPKSTRRLFMRIATKADVKERGAERRSEYYRKHGNPHYGNMAGLISRSKKMRFRREKEKQLVNEAKVFVSGGRSEVKYDPDDPFSETYNEESEGSQAADYGELGNVFIKRKRPLEISNDEVSLEAELNELLKGNKRKGTPMMRMAADEEEEKIAAKRQRTKDALDTLDVRKQIERRRKDRELDDAPVFFKPTVPDLRSRLSRIND